MIQRKTKNDSQLQLHLGCGDIFIPGFIHIDQDDFEHVDHVKDISDLSMFSEYSVDLIYALRYIL